MSDDGQVYLIHFADPYKHARHYVGWSQHLEARLEHHRAGTGAKLMDVVTKAGIYWVVVRTWAGGRDLERRIKNRHNASQLCPVCRAIEGKPLQGDGYGSP